MAVKDHSLDGKIIDAATQEFLEKGYQKASLSSIVSRAGITTGALYTRYKSKDEMFCSLIEPVISKITKMLQPLWDEYQIAKENKDPVKMMETVKKERSCYLDIMYKYKTECILFLCKSDGSSIEQQIKQIINERINDTVSFVKEVSNKQIDLDGIGFIITQQFYYYRNLLEKDYSKKKAKACMESVELFIEAGWETFFSEVL